MNGVGEENKKNSKLMSRCCISLHCHFLALSHLNQKQCGWVDTRSRSPCYSALTSFNLFNIDSTQQTSIELLHLLNTVKSGTCLQYFPKSTFLMKLCFSAVEKYSTPHLISSIFSQHRSQRWGKIHLGSQGLAFSVTTCFTHQGMCRAHPL